MNAKNADTKFLLIRLLKTIYLYIITPEYMFVHLIGICKSAQFKGIIAKYNLFYLLFVYCWKWHTESHGY